ncbi:hypothetical protein [Anaerococcus hydrogenalis]|uniref:hypothetical protein n=1 Tax=Anaerococcus hydrogenalis TaxID=33029 RepID=UPI002901997F|nr:hypothetical protein [Anaerococcus hydrogenalis]MDU1316098.1 hypothetical protein [Anaerococcus hydrogenalis]
MKDKKKMGRPTDNPKKYQTRIRMTEEEKQILEFCADKSNKTKTDIINMGVKKVFEEIKKNS